MLNPQIPFQWTIHEKTQDQREWQEDQEHTPPTSIHQSHLKLNLPHLGEVAIAIHLRGNQVQLNIHATSNDAISTLNTHSGSLKSALELSGTELAAYKVSTHD